jgi:hypothetical protein
MGFLDTVTSFIPGWKTLEGVGKGIGKVFQGDFKGALQAVGKGLSNDWGLTIATLFIPGLNAAGAARLAGVVGKLGIAQLGAVGADFLGVFGKDGEGQGRQQEAVQYAGGQYAQQQGHPIQGPNIGW